jgi:Tfp pilus assembly protein PilV
MSSESEWREIRQHHRLIWESIAQRSEQNTGWKPMVLYAGISSHRVHGDSSRDCSQTPPDSPENNVAWASSLCSFALSGDAFHVSTVFPRIWTKIRLKLWAESSSPFGAAGVSNPRNKTWAESYRTF